MNNRTTTERKLFKSTGLTAFTFTPFKGDTMIKGTPLAEFRLSLLAGFIAIILTFSACSSSDDDTPINNFGTPVPAANFTLNSVKYWVNTDCNSGCDSAMMVVQWNDGKTPVALVWGYLFDSTKTTSATDSATGEDMIMAIVKDDPRLYLLSYKDPNHPDYGIAVGGIGFDPDSPDEILKLSRDGEAPEAPDGNGFFTPRKFWNTHITPNDSSFYDFDLWTCPNCGDSRWQSGWYDGNWWYYVDSASTWGLSEVGTSSRRLKKGSRDLHSYANSSYVWPNGPSFPTTLTPILPPK